jgi:membrane dipeptidase
MEGDERIESQSELVVIDGHQDLAYNALAYGRDIRRSALDTRRREKGSAIPRTNGQCMIGLPELLQGRVAIVFGTVFVMPARRSESSLDITYRDVQQAHSQGMAQLDVYRRWADDMAEIVLVGERGDLEMVLRSWRGAGDGGEFEPRVGIVPLMENADPIREPAELELWVERGTRIVGPSWAGSRYAGGVGEPAPLTDLGRELLEVMEDLDVALDLSHMAEPAAIEAMDRFGGVVLASHSNPAAILPTDRHLSDPLIERIAERDGVIGIVPYNGFLRPDWYPGERKDRTTLTDVVRAIDYVCQRVGDADHVAIGSDFDGGFGSESAPAQIDTVADLPKIAEALREHGFELKHTEAIMFGNWLRLLQHLLPE